MFIPLLAKHKLSDSVSRMMRWSEISDTYTLQATLKISFNSYLLSDTQICNLPKEVYNEIILRKL